MKRIVLIALILGLAGCATMGSGRTIVIGDPRAPQDPPTDLRVAIFNNSNRWVKIERVAGFDTMIIGPHKEAFLQCRRLGQYEVVAYAYRSARAGTKNVKLGGFIGERIIQVNLNGSTRTYQGRHFGAVITFTDNQFRYRSKFRYRSNGTGIRSNYKWGPVTLDLFGRSGGYGSNRYNNRSYDRRHYDNRRYRY